MGSASNWLAFSLSQQEHHTAPPPHQTPDRLNYSAAAAAAAAFSNQIRGRSFTSLEDGSSSELSMVVGSVIKEDNPEPKLEDFLSGNFSSHSQKLPPGCNSMTWTFDNSSNLQIPTCQSAAKEVSVTGNHAGSDCSIGLSMIKTWLRTQPAQPFAAKSQTLSFSMNTPSRVSPSPAENGGDGQEASAEAGPRRSTDSSGHRTSIYRGVTRHRWTGRYEAHLWDNSCKREGQTRKGRQVYLGGYDKEEKAAIAYDLAALKYWGTMTTTNFPMSNYRRELEEMRNMTRLEYVASLRRKSSGFSRGASVYRGVTRHHQQGRWQARIGRVAGNKDLYLGTFSTQEEAAEAYDIAAIKFRGLNAVTNFDMNRYDVKSIMESNGLPVGGPAKRSPDHSFIVPVRFEGHESATSLAPGINTSNFISWPGIPFNPSTASYSYSQLQDWSKQDHGTLRTLRDLHHHQYDGAANRYLPPPMQDAVRLDSSPAIYGSSREGFLGEQGEDFPTPRPFSFRNMYNIAEQSPSSEAIGNSLPVCYGGPLFSVWNDR